MIEKVALALVLTMRQMCPYFQNHSIIVRTDYPIFKILSKPDLAGRMSGWSLELSEFNIRYQPQGGYQVSVPSRLLDRADTTTYPVGRVDTLCG